MFSCPCCEYLTFGDEPNGTYEICPVCFWEDDPIQNMNPEMGGGANYVCLNTARDNFVTYGASEQRFLKNVRKPNQQEKPISIQMLDDAIEAGDIDEVCRAIVGASLNCESYTITKAKCLHLLKSDNTALKQISITCLGHLARLYPSQSTVEVRRILMTLLYNPDLSGRIFDAFDDMLRYSIDQHIGEYDIVRLILPNDEHQLLMGIKGTVVMELDENTVEVEFSDRKTGITMELLTLKIYELELIWTSKK